MRKTPLSTPGGSYGRNNKRFDGSGGSGGSGGYGQSQGDLNHGCFTPGDNPPPSQHKSGDDFIPLGFSSPVNHRPRNNSGNWRGRGNPHRHRGTPPVHGAFNHSYRQNFYGSPRSNTFDESNSPKYFQRNHQNNYSGQRKPRQTDWHRQVDISSYLNVSSILEDPWSELMKNLDKSHSFSQDKSESFNNCTASESSCGSILIGNLNVKSNSPNLAEDHSDPKVAAEDCSEKSADDKTTIPSDTVAETTS